MRICLFTEAYELHIRPGADGRMEETYKAHVIRSGARPVPNSSKWKPVAQVCWREGQNERKKTWMGWHFKRSFSTERTAEIAAHLFAKKWIDDGKPNLEP
jgi:hypothetical protein